MRGSFLLPLFLFLYCVVGADNRQLQPNVRQTVRQCDVQPLWWDIKEDATTEVVFEVGFTAVQQALWSVTIVKRSFTDPTNTTIVDHASDCSHVQWTVKPEEVNVMKKNEFGCGDLNGRWWIIVKHDAQVPRDFVVNLSIRRVNKQDALQVVPLAVGRTKDEARTFFIKGGDTAKEPLNRFSFFTLQIPTFAAGSRIMIECKPIGGRHPMRYLSYDRLALPGICSLEQNNAGNNFELGNCQASRSGTWFFTVEMDTDIQYEVKAYLVEPRYQDIEINRKYTITFLTELETIYFRLPPTIWDGVTNSTTDSLVPVVDNVINGRVRLGANYDDLPFDTCRNYAQQCATDVGCHLIVGPCDHDGKHDRNWIFGVEALKFHQLNAPITITFSVKSASYTLKNLGIGENGTKTGALENGLLSEYLLPASTYLSSNATGSWITVGVYVDAAKRFQERGGSLNGYLYISDGPFAGPNEGCYSNKKFCSIAETSTDYMSCSIQLDPCDLQLYENGVYVSLLAIDLTDELWYQEKLPYTLRVERDNPLEKAKHWLDDGDVVTDIIQEGHYKFYYIPPHRGSLTVSITAPWERDVPTTPKNCSSLTIYGVRECTGTPDCGWCNTQCVPCSGKVGQSVVCNSTSILGCIAQPSTPTPTPVPVTPNDVDDPCASLDSTFCSDIALAGVCGWCNTQMKCGSCSRTLPPESWCGSSKPSNCRDVRIVSKRAEQQTYGDKEVRLLVIYGDKVEGPSCPCWKPSQAVDVRKGETLHQTVSSCATDLSKGLYVAVTGIVPTPSATAWTCIPGYTTPVRLNGVGVVECMSFNGKECYWGDGPCTATKLAGNGSPILPLSCIEVRRLIGGADGYSYETKWCDDTLKFFTDKFHRYAQNKYILSIEQAPVTTKQQVTNLEPNVVQEDQLASGEVHYYELIFPRKNLANSSLVIDVRAHANSGFEFTYGILQGQSGANYDCLELDSPQVCTPTDKNKGQCIFLYNSCSWKNDKDNRRMMIKVKRTGGIAGEVGPIDLYNLHYVLSTKEPTQLRDNVPVASSIFAREYAHFQFVVPKDKIASSLVIEVYFDAGRETDAAEQVELFLNGPTVPELAGDLNDCFCHQLRWAGARKIVAIINPCDMVEGIHRFSVRTNIFTRDSFKAKFTVLAYLKPSFITNFPWDTLQDGSLYVDQTSHFTFALSSSFIAGEQDVSNIMTFRVYSTQRGDSLTMTLRSGQLTCDCNKQAIKSCTTQEDATGRPFCEFTMEYCEFPQSGDYTLSVSAKRAVDVTNPVPYTVAVWRNNKQKEIIKLTSADSCSTTDRSDERYFKYIVIEPDAVQHVSLTFKNKGSTLIPQIYLDGVKFGTVVVSTNLPNKLATPACSLSNLPPYYCSQPNCIVKLACGDDVGMISLKALATKANQPVVVKLSVCSGTVEETRFTGAPKDFSLAPFGFEIVNIVRFALVDGSAWSAIFKYAPNVPADGKVTITINQGMCSTCRGFTRTKICVGPCQIEIHYWELPLNYDKSDWIMQISNENAYPLTFSITSIRSVLPGANNLISNTPAVASVAPLGWAYYRYVVTAPSYWQGLEVADVNMEFTSTIPSSGTIHGISYATSTTPPTLGSNIKLAELPIAGKLFELGKCCVSSQTFYIMIFNSNPTSGWSLKITPKLNFLSLHTELPWISNQASGTILARPVDSRPAADRQFGPISYQAYVDFPGVYSRDGVMPTGTYVRGYANRDKSVSPAFPTNTHFYLNTNGPAGSGSCFNNLYYVRSPEFWSQQWFACQSQNLGIASFWFGIINAEIGGDFRYNVGLERIDPVPKDLGVQFVDKAPPQEWKQYEFKIEDRPALGVRYKLDVAVTDHFGGVKVAMNLEAPAAEDIDALPCAGEWLADKVAKAYRVQVQQCDTYFFEGSLVRVCYPVVLSGAGNSIYDSCQMLTFSKGKRVLKQPPKRLYLGVKPFCNIQALADPTFASNTKCLSASTDNPTYSIKLTVEDTFASTRVTLTEGVAYRLNRYTFQDANAAIFRYRAPTGIDSTYGFLLVEITAINNEVPMVIGWSTDGCNFNRKETVCTNAGGAMRCSLIIYPCNWQPGAIYDFFVTAPTMATTGFTIKSSAITNIEPYLTRLRSGESATVTLDINELKFFQIDLTSTKGIALEPADRIVVELVEVGCGTVNAWINRETPGGPECNVNPGGRPCTGGSCTLMDISACNILNSDSPLEYYISVVGVTRASTETIKAKVRVRVIKSSPTPVKTKAIYDNEEHPIMAIVADQEPQCAIISERALAAQDDCCSLTPPLPGANDTRLWRIDDIHFVYTVVGGHHLGSGAGTGTRVTVGLRPEIQSALVYFITDKARFCESSPPTPCRATETERCTYDLRTCRQTIRQLYIWIDPNSVRWYDPSGRPNVPPSQNSYQIGWVRTTKQEVSIVAVSLPPSLPPSTPIYHPFWLMPGEITYIKIEHPELYTKIPNYHVRISVEGVTNGPVTIAQALGWNSCSDGECVVQDCSFGDVQNDTSVTQCRKRTANCYCQNYKDISLPVCLTEELDDDQADFFQLQTPRTGTQPIYGRLKITLNEVLLAGNASVCNTIRTGQHRYFRAPTLGGANHVYKFTVFDMEDDFGAVKMTLNDDSVAVPGTCADKSSCRANGGSCTLYYRKGDTIPGITITGDNAGKVLGLAGNHKFRLELTSVPVTIYDLQNSILSVSPKNIVDGRCLTPVAPQYYRYTTRITDNYALFRVVSHSANVWINRGSLSHSRGEWSCNTRNKGFCEILIACAFKGGDVYFVHVEGGAHEITVNSYPVNLQSISLGESKDFTFTSVQPFTAFFIKGIDGRYQDSSRQLEIFASGPISDSWITKDSFGSQRCKVTAAYMLDAKPGNILTKQTWTYRVPTCYVGVQSDIFHLNILSTTSECDGYIYHISSQFSDPDGATIVNGLVPGKVPAGGVTRHRIDRGILKSPLNRNSVLLVKIRDASAPVESVVLKSNFINRPTCQTSCSSNPTSDAIYWLDDCWHCGGEAYDTVFVEVKAKDLAFTNEILFNLDVQHKAWEELSNAWVEYNFDTVSRDFAFFAINLKKQTSMMIELEVLGKLGVDIEIYPSDCIRRNLQLALTDQALKYKCYPSEGTCQIPFSKENNWGSSSSQANYLWADDNVRLVVKGYATSFRIRVRRGLLDLCTNVTKEQAPFCSTYIPDGSTWGNPENFEAKDRWAERWWTKLVAGFDCPVSRNCECRPVSEDCRDALQEFACVSTFGKCNTNGWKNAGHVDKCRAVEQACYKTFVDAGFPLLDCRHSYYDGARLLSDGKGCALSGCPPVIPPEPVPAPEPKIQPNSPEQEIIYPEPSPFPEPANDTSPIVEEDSGLSLVAILGIVLGCVSAVLVLSIITFFVKRHLAAAA